MSQQMSGKEEGKKNTFAFEKGNISSLAIAVFNRIILKHDGYISDIADVAVEPSNIHKTWAYIINYQQLMVYISTCPLVLFKNVFYLIVRTLVAKLYCTPSVKGLSHTCSQCFFTKSAEKAL